MLLFIISNGVTTNRFPEITPDLTSCKAVALCPVTSLHMMICSSRMTWNVDRMGLLSSTLNRWIRVGSTSLSSLGTWNVTVFQQTYSSVSPAASELCLCISVLFPSSPPALSASPLPFAHKKKRKQDLLCCTVQNIKLCVLGVQLSVILVFEYSINYSSDLIE